MRLTRLMLVLSLICLLGSWTPDSMVLAADAAGVEAGKGHDEPSLLRGPKESLITAITTLVVFLALVAVLGKTAWGPIAQGLQDRENKIRKDIADAEAARARAEATLAEYNRKLADAEGQIRELLARAQADGEKVATNIRMQAQAEAEDIKKRATRDIETARASAVREIHEHAATLATSVAEKIIRRNLNADDQRELVRASLDQLDKLPRN